jgi:hypothetical protein
MVELLKTTDGELPWRFITINADDASGPTWDKLRQEYHRQLGFPKVEKIKIYWRKKDGEHTFIFSPLAAIEATRERLKDLPLKNTAARDQDKLLDDGYSASGRIPD